MSKNFLYLLSFHQVTIKTFSTICPFAHSEAFKITPWIWSNCKRWRELLFSFFSPSSFSLNFVFIVANSLIGTREFIFFSFLLSKPEIFQIDDSFILIRQLYSPVLRKDRNDLCSIAVSYGTIIFLGVKVWCLRDFSLGGNGDSSDTTNLGGYPFTLGDQCWHCLMLFLVQLDSLLLFESRHSSISF